MESKVAILGTCRFEDYCCLRTRSHKALRNVCELLSLFGVSCIVFPCHCTCWIMSGTDLIHAHVDLPLHFRNYIQDILRPVFHDIKIVYYANHKSQAAEMLHLYSLGFTSFLPPTVHVILSECVKKCRNFGFLYLGKVTEHPVIIGQK